MTMTVTTRTSNRASSDVPSVGQIVPWLKALFSSRRAVPAMRPAAVGEAALPEGLRIYAFGDIHGRHDLAHKMIADIRRDIRRAPGGLKVKVIGLGDYIDRGPRSKQVLQLLCSAAKGNGFEFIGLRGNHEEMFLRIVNGEVDQLAKWISWGGGATLQSYGVNAVPNANPVDIRQQLIRAMPLEHVMFLQRLSTSHAEGDFFFCHAGARPGVPLDRQKQLDLLWIGADFSGHDHPFERVVVHGHTSVPEPQILSHRIAIDTGAYETGRLTCIVIEGKTVRLLETVGTEGRRR